MTTDCTSEYKALKAAADAEGKKTRLSLSYTGEPEEETERRLREIWSAVVAERAEKEIKIICGE